jgi:hypothetical protein
MNNSYSNCSKRARRNEMGNCKQCDRYLTPEMIVFYIGNGYICDGCRKKCRDCHRSLCIDVPVHIVNDTVVCDDCYQGEPIKTPESL